MKKSLSVLLAVVLAISMLCGGALAEAADVVGDWYLNVLVMEGAEMNPATFGMEMVVTLNEDGTALTLMTGGDEQESSEGVWTMEGDVVTLTIEEDTMALTLTEGELVADEGDGSFMHFGRERVAAAAFVPAPVRVDTKIEEFDGVWNVFLVDMFGMQLPVEMLGDLLGASMITLSIENGNVTMTTELEDEVLSVDYLGELADGVLTVTMVDEYDNVSVMPLVLHEDGILSYMDGEAEDEMTATFYFELFVEEEAAQ